MLDSFIRRENEIFEILKKFQEKGLDFILVGGYAVAVYRHRFSIDADIVISHENLAAFEKVLHGNGFERRISKVLPYKGEFRQYVKKSELPVTADLLIGGLAVRQTNASWDFQYISEHSEIKPLQGISTEIEVKIPEKELLIAMKLHSARATDLRDVVALFEGVSLRKIEEYLNYPKKDCTDSLQTALKMLEDPRLSDAFKGSFQTKRFEESTIIKLKKFIESKLSE